MTAPPRRSDIGLIMLVVLGLLGANAPLISAADPAPATPTSVSTSASPNPVTFQSAVNLTATVTPVSGGGTITWSVVDHPGEVLPVSAVDPVTGVAVVTVTLGAGPNGIVAVFSGAPGFAPSTSNPLLVGVVGPGTPTVTLLAASATTVEEHGPVTFTATVTPASAQLIEFLDGITWLGNADADPATGTARLTVGLGGVGNHQVSALAIGDGVFAGSLSAPVTVQTTPDVSVLASGQGVSPAAFYPYKDGYRDTAVVRGTLAEPGSVAITIYNPAGKKIRTATVKPPIPGPYSFVWNGRSASGALQPAGRYRVIQIVSDTRGHKKTVATYLTISAKRLVWKTASQTKFGEAYSYWNASTYAYVSRAYSMFSRGVELYGNVLDSWAWVEYDFKIPSAIQYGKFTWAVTGSVHRPTTTGGPAWLGLWDYKVNDDNTVYAQTGLAYGTYSIRTAGTDFVKSRKVRAFVSVYGDEYGDWDVEKVKLTYRYAVLD